MNTKIKKIAYFGASALMLIAPVVVFGQLDTSAGGETGLANASIGSIIYSIMLWLLYLVGIIAVIGFAISGIMYLTAAGDDDQITRAKRAMLMSIVGVIVALMGLVILNAVQAMLGADKNI